jgi:hypothetical protein
MFNLPTELLIKIIDGLGPFDLGRWKLTHKRAGSAVSKRQIKHFNLWKSVFRDDTWLNKVVAKGFCPAIINPESSHRVLVLLHNQGEDFASTNKSPQRDFLLSLQKDFLSSLQSDRFSLENLEVHFQEFILNVNNICEPNTTTDVPDSMALCNSRGGRFFMDLIHYEDQTARIHSIEAIVPTDKICLLRFPGFTETRVFIRRSNEPNVRRRLGRPMSFPDG